MTTTPKHSTSDEKPSKKRVHISTEIKALVPDLRMLVHGVHASAIVSTDAALKMASMAAALTDKVDARARHVRDAIGRDTLFVDDLQDAARALLPKKLFKEVEDTYKVALEKRAETSKKRKASEAHKAAMAKRQATLKAKEDTEVGQAERELHEAKERLDEIKREAEEKERADRKAAERERARNERIAMLAATQQAVEAEA